ncbi:urease accessory protein UreD [Methylobacterium gregans]|uniref:Urease accessory protein UreD n=1 Tax=Methylobacterium gregans TaxID=374424 RepID=A0AA37HT61_9HYPH|nr:urease accessory protein UreD [Methylobacterium gregans]MDQ0522908.1 urease accessory protein [Methylobacterium gregans]GJD81529.1 Urease accessory protein UreD [Methylobacterium gregans]GLS55803.1 urease accessory protein UreD [Methylobacterium gregans]
MNAHVPLTVPSTGAAPARQRSVGHVALLAEGPGPARLRDLAEAGPLRLRFPRRHGADETEAVLVNTAGGVACGDRFSVAIDLAAEARLCFTSTAAEKIYRSDGPISRIENRVRLGPGARLAWLPQETILFDRVRVRRSFEADLAPDAALLIFEAVAFGRTARGETLGAALFEDAWRVRRAGRLVYADALRLDGAVGALLARPAIGGGAAACATLLDLSPGAEARLDEARGLLDGAATLGVETGASAWNGHLVVRMLAPAIGPLRSLAARFLEAYRAAPLPRVWQS